MQSITTNTQNVLL